MDKLLKFQEPAGELPTNFVSWDPIYRFGTKPNEPKMSTIDQFRFNQESPLRQFVQTVSSEEGKQNQQYSGNYYYTSTKDSPRPNWIFIRSEEPLKSMEQEIAEYLPGTGDATEVINIGKDISQGNIGQALLAAGLFLIPGNWRKVWDNIKIAQTAKSFKKIPTWRDRAIYSRHNDIKKMWNNQSEDELQKHVSIKPTEKAKDRYLSQTYQGQYTTTPEEQFVRVNNTSQDRVKWIKEHSVKELPSYTNLEEQLELADRTWANEYLNPFRKALDENVKYSSENLGDRILGESEGSILKGAYGNPPEGQIQTIFEKGDKSPIAETTLGHEAAIHGSGNLDDEYVYQYLKENDIVDFDNVSPYFKDADRGEIGAHLSEVPSYLGFKKETLTSKYQTPEGKTKINKDDVENYNRFQRETGIDPSRTITGNVKDWPKFLEFLNGHKFMWILPLFGVGATKAINIENDENNQTRN